MQAEIDRLKADLGRLRTELSGFAEDAAHAAKVGTAEAREILAQKAKALAEKGREGVDATEKQIAEHPFIAIGAALAVGALVGIMISRSLKE
jgi:ElaB/YqjD/DUF883 family membrane-anchored ribosome-binding protein